ncbi:MAG: response regulator [Marinobacter sp.]|uniref:response regulator n=1 Tax=Marinobacter sp. TaxID=50741 RepID=UPI00299DFA41|nr:response regulator [Marinobacter sp.]MDX1755259.1 response regulator [Marinobacter sp.]
MEDSGDANHQPPPSVAPQLARLRQNFLAELPQRVDAIQTALLDLRESLDQRDISQVLAGLEQLHQRLHKLIGAAGTFGVARVSAKARQMSDLVDETFRASSWPSQKRINQLRQLTEELRQCQQPPFEPDTGFSEIDAPLSQAPKSHCTAHVVDDDPIQVELIRSTLSKAGYQVEVFSAVTVYADLFVSLERPDIIFMDMRFDGDQYAGADRIQTLKQAHDNLPPVVFVSAMQDIHARLAALRAGATRYLTKPLDAPQLVRMADELSLRIPEKPYRVMLVDDDADVLAAYGLVLSRAGLTTLTVNQPLETLNQLEEFRPDVLILDLNMPEVNGAELAALIREDERHEPLPILFLSAESDPWRKMSIIGLGGDEFLPKPVAADYLITTVTARARRARRQRKLLQLARQSSP